MKKINIIAVSLIAMLTMFSSCIQEKYEIPQTDNVPTGDTITITRLWEMYDSLILINGTYKFTTDCSVFGYITMSDKIGNIYKSAYLQGDPDSDDKAINLHLLSSGGVYEGDYVRIYLKGLVLGDYSGMIQLDSVHVDNNIVKLDTRKFLEPELVTIEEINTGEYVGKLVKLNNVQFSDDDLGTTYADNVKKTTVNKTLEDCEGNTIIVRNSGYANFAGELLPTGKGSLIAVVGKYNSDWQLYIRTSDEVVMEKNRCGVYEELCKNDFENTPIGEFADDGWQNIASSGNSKWKCQDNERGHVLRIDGVNAEANTTWLITPSFTATNKSAMSFATACISSGSTLKVYVSSNYNGNDPTTATWTELNANFATSSSWATSGAISLAQYSGNIRIAFKFESPVGSTTKYFLDDFVVYNEED